MRTPLGRRTTTASRVHTRASPERTCARARSELTAPRRSASASVSAAALVGTTGGARAQQVAAMHHDDACDPDSQHRAAERTHRDAVMPQSRDWSARAAVSSVWIFPLRRTTCGSSFACASASRYTRSAASGRLSRS